MKHNIKISQSEFEGKTMRPNILYIHSHDTGRYIQPYGYAIPTPNLQRLAEDGILFRKAFCMAPTCSPSRAALLTGQSPHSSGMLGLAHRGFCLKDYSQHIIHVLKETGYYTALAGVQHVSSDPTLIGYDKILDEDLLPDKFGHLNSNRLVSLVDPFLREAVLTRQNQPFFLSVGFVETHREYPVSGWQEDARYTLPPSPLPDFPETRQDMANFKASARMYDRGVGMILDLLAELNLTDNTLVICTTDHGIAFPGMKCNLTDHGIGVMLIMRGPDGFTGGKVIDGMVSHIDIFPTICEILEIQKPSWLQGKSFVPLVKSHQQEINEEIFAEVTYHAAYEPMRAIRTDRFKYIRRFDTRSTPVLPNIDDSPSKSIWLDNNLQNRFLPQEYLYDLVFDPNETNNLSSHQEYQTIFDDLKARLHRWMLNTSDIILSENPVHPPIGTTLNPVDQCSPNDPVIYIG